MRRKDKISKGVRMLQKQGHRVSPGDYVIYSHKTGHRLIVKADGSVTHLSTDAD